MNRRVAPWFFALALIGLAAPAFAWFARAPFGAKVHGHEFRKVMLESAECGVRYRLYFAAPASGYGAQKHTYRFKARIRLHSGKAVVSPVFYNSAPGERVYARTHDTSQEGCWAKEEQKLLAVDVRACKGRDCTPEAFDP
jgi:hypothetical protein